MKGRVLFVLLLHVALASTLSGCRTADVVGGQAAHRAALQMGVPETQKNGDVNITLRVQGNAHYRTFEWNMTLYHDSNQCFVQASKVYMAGNFSFKGRILPLPEK